MVFYPKSSLNTNSQPNRLQNFIEALKIGKNLICVVTLYDNVLRRGFPPRCQILPNIIGFFLPITQNTTMSILVINMAKM